LSAVWRALLQIAAVANIRAKQPCFSHEEEWRTFIFGDAPTVKPLRKHDGSEYTELRLRTRGRLAFKEILLGPRQDSRADAVARARRILEAAAYTPDEMPPIEISTATLE
jgi:hypothetical protein